MQSRELASFKSDGLRHSGLFSLPEMDRAVEYLFREHCPPAEKNKFRIFPSSTLARSMRESVRLDEDVLRADWLVFPVPTMTNEGDRTYVLLLVSFPAFLLKKNKVAKQVATGCEPGIWL